MAFLTVQLLMQREGGKRREKPEDDLALLDQIQAVNPSAGSQYLEHIVLQRRNPVWIYTPSCWHGSIFVYKVTRIAHSFTQIMYRASAFFPPG